MQLDGDGPGSSGGEGMVSDMALYQSIADKAFFESCTRF